jgi:hypothetical protein
MVDVLSGIQLNRQDLQYFFWTLVILFRDFDVVWRKRWRSLS